MGSVGFNVIKVAISITNLHVFAMWVMIPPITIDTDSNPHAYLIPKMRPLIAQAYKNNAHITITFINRQWNVYLVLLAA